MSVLHLLCAEHSYINIHRTNLLTISMKLNKQVKAPAIGNDNILPGGNYYGDGFEVPSFKSIAKKRSFKSDSLTLNSIKADMLDPMCKTKASLGQLLSGSTQMLQQAVGTAHRLFLINDLFISACDEYVTLYKGDKPNEFLDTFKMDQGLVQILAEIYEVPLGGFDPWAYRVFYDYIMPYLSGTKTIERDLEFTESQIVEANGLILPNLNTLAGVMVKAGMNGTIKVDPTTGDIKDSNGKRDLTTSKEVVNIPDRVIDAIEISTECADLCNPKHKIYKLDFVWDITNTKTFFGLTAQISFLLSKGKFLPEKTEETSVDYVELTDEYFGYGEYSDEEDYYEEEVVVKHSTERLMLNAYVTGRNFFGIDIEDAIQRTSVFGSIEYYIQSVCNAFEGETVKVDTSYFNKEIVEMIQTELETSVVKTMNLNEDEMEVIVESEDYVDVFSQWADANG